MNSAAPHEHIIAGDGNDCSLSYDSPASRRLTGVVLRENNRDSSIWWRRIHSRTDSTFYTLQRLSDTSLFWPEARSFARKRKGWELFCFLINLVVNKICKYSSDSLIDIVRLSRDFPCITLIWRSKVQHPKIKILSFFSPCRGSKSVYDAWNMKKIFWESSQWFLSI